MFSRFAGFDSIGDRVSADSRRDFFRALRSPVQNASKKCVIEAMQFPTKVLVL